MRGKNKNITIVMVSRLCLFVTRLPVCWMQGKTLENGEGQVKGSKCLIVKYRKKFRILRSMLTCTDFFFFVWRHD